MKHFAFFTFLLIATTSWAKGEKVCAFYQDYDIHVPQERYEIFAGNDYHNAPDAEYIKAIKKKPLIRKLVTQTMIDFSDGEVDSTSLQDLIIENGPDARGRDLTVYKLRFKKKALMNVGATEEQATRLSKKTNLYYVDHGAGDNGMGAVYELRGYIDKKPLISMVALGGDNDFSTCPSEYNINYKPFDVVTAYDVYEGLEDGSLKVKDVKNSTWLEQKTEDVSIERDFHENISYVGEDWEELLEYCEAKGKGGNIGYEDVSMAVDANKITEDGKTKAYIIYLFAETKTGCLYPRDAVVIDKKGNIVDEDDLYEQTGTYFLKLLPPKYVN